MVFVARTQLCCSSVKASHRQLVNQCSSQPLFTETGVGCSSLTPSSQVTQLVSVVLGSVSPTLTTVYKHRGPQVLAWATLLCLSALPTMSHGLKYHHVPRKPWLIPFPLL